MPEEIGGQLGALRMEDERAAHAQRAAEQAGLEHHVVARRGLALARLRPLGCWSSRPARRRTRRSRPRCVSSTSRSSVDTPGLKTAVHGSTSATSASPRVSACTSFACLPEEPRKMRALVHARIAFRSRDDGQPNRRDAASTRFPGGRVRALPDDGRRRSRDHRFMNTRTRISVAGIVAVGIALAATAMAFAALQQRSGPASVRTAKRLPISRLSATGSTAGCQRRVSQASRSAK